MCISVVVRILIVKYSFVKKIHTQENCSTFSLKSLWFLLFFRIYLHLQRLQFTKYKLSGKRGGEILQLTLLHCTYIYKVCVF